MPGAVIGIPGLDSDGRILLLSPDGLLIRDGKGWQKIDRSVGLRGAVYSVFEDRQHSLWIGLAGRGVAQWRGYQDWSSYSTASGLSSDIVYEIQPQADGTLWVGTEGGLLRGEHQGSGVGWKKVVGLDGFPVHGVRTSPDGDLWIGTEARGVAHLHVRTGAVEWFGEAQGLTGKLAYTVRFDREQRLWAATEAGLFMATAPYHRFSRVGELPATQMWAVAEGSDGVIWAGGTDGLFAYANGHWKNFTHARKNTSHLTAAVNISARQLLNPDFVKNVLTILQRTGANPQNLKLELTESMFVDDLEDVVANMTALKSHGLRFALDDFGMGYSSLAYLRRLPLDQLKIDQEFVRDILVDASSSAIAQSIISLSRAMGLSVIAEGVETEGQRDYLARLGCHSFQGFLFSGPLPVEEFQRLLPSSARNAASSHQ
jgi:EAL domain-containing protein (putative c-di-GMP-specific phosphodiesterase class I)